MKKIEVLEIARAYMVKFGIHSYNLSEPKNEFFRSIGAYYIMTSAVFVTMAHSASFAYKYRENFDEITESLLTFVAGLQSFGTFLSFGFNVNKAKALQIELQALVDEDNGEEIHEAYANVEEKSRRVYRITCLYLWVHPIMFGAAILYSIYCISVGNLDTETWLVPYRICVLFDHTSVGGWYLFLLVQSQMGNPYSIGLVALMFYFAGCCYYITGICDHFDCLVKSIHERMESNRKANSFNRDKEKRMIAESLSKIIDIHIKIFEIFRMVSEMNSGVIFWLLPPGVVFAALTMYNTEHSTFDVVMMAFHVICLVTSLAWPFLYCYFATFTTGRIAMLGDTMYNTNWPDYPPMLQKYVILIVARSQEPIYFTGLNLMYCTLELFGKYYIFSYDRPSKNRIFESASANENELLILYSLQKPIGTLIRN